MTETKTASKNTIYIVLLGLAVILLVMGFVFSPSIPEMIAGYQKMLTHPALIDFDVLQYVGHYGTGFFNSGLLLLVVLLVYRLTNTDIQGVQIAAAMMVLGFAFYGKNIVNIWFPVIGVFLYARLRGKTLSSVTALAWFATALSPVFSVTAFGTEALAFGSPVAIALGACLGILGGVLVGVFADYLPSLHKGYVLYNAGFAAGLAGMLINALQKVFGIGHDRFAYEATDYVSGDNAVLGIVFAILFAYLIVAGFVLGGGSKWKQILTHKSKGGNYVEKFGLAASLINMGVVGLMATALVLVSVKGQLGGCLFACIWTAAGFAACGVTPRTYLPVMAGVCIGAFLTGGIAGMVAGESFLGAALTKFGSRPMLVAAIFSAGVAPIAGEHGVLAGIVVGAIHSVLVPNIAVLHGWMSLYNNGFCLSLIATFLHPIYSRFGLKETASVAGSVGKPKAI